MSKSRGMVLFPSGTIRYFLYNDTVSTPHTRIYGGIAEMDADWDKGKFPAAKCVCGQGEKALLYVESGDGFSWTGKACDKCKAIIIGDEDEQYITRTHGAPRWVLLEDKKRLEGGG